jgi:Holliday junction resolvasome RuvABC endonuclease subunit
MSNILSFDPSITEFGLAIINSDTIIDAECIKTNPGHSEHNITKSRDKARRASKIVKRILDVLCHHRIKTIVSELPQGSQSAPAADCLGMARSIVQTIADCYSKQIIWVKQHDSKMTMVGKSDAEKHEMIDAVDNSDINFPELGDPKDGAPWTGIKYRDEAIADAVAVYITAKNHEDYEL